MSRKRSFSTVPDCPSGVGGALDCLGLCAICEVVMWYLNTNLTYSEDGGKMYCKKIRDRIGDNIDDRPNTKWCIICYRAYNSQMTIPYKSRADCVEANGVRQLKKLKPIHRRL